MKQLTCIAAALGFASAALPIDKSLVKPVVRGSPGGVPDLKGQVNVPVGEITGNMDQLQALNEKLLPKLVKDTGGARPVDADPSRLVPDTGRPEVVNARPAHVADAYRVTNLAVLSYCPDASLKAWFCRPCLRLGKEVEIVESHISWPHQGRVVLLKDTRRKEIIVSFRGSVNLPNWVANLLVEQTDVPYARGARVHYGFKELTHELLKYYLESLKRLLHAHPSFRLVITGHSLGGALSTMLAAELGHRHIVPWDRMSTYTYGEPRVGNLAFVRWLNAQKLHMTRVVNEDDVVPHLVVARAGYVHHATEMHIQNNRTSVCSTSKLEDISCSLSRFPALSIIRHNQAWDMALGAFGC